MEDIIRNFLWFEYEGKIIHDLWYKNIIHISDKQKQKIIVKNIFRDEDIKKFYQLGNAIWNISNLFREEDISNDLILEKYFYILEDNKEERYVDLLLFEYHIWLYNTNLLEYKFFLDLIKHKIKII